MRGFLVGGVIAATLALAAAVAVAETEPNDVISQAEGPISGAQPLGGTLNATGDTDFYLFYVGSQQSISLTAVDTTNAPLNCLKAQLLDADGGPFNEALTTPLGTSRMFVKVYGTVVLGCQYPLNYSFRLSPAGAVTTGPALDKATNQTSDLNETPAQAGGPLTSGVNYVGSFDRQGDRDWFTLDVPTGTQDLDLVATSPNQNFTQCEATASLYSSPDPASLIATAVGDWTTFGHVRRRVSGGRYYVLAGVKTDGCLASRWQIRVDHLAPSPPGAVPGPIVDSVVRARARYTTVVSMRRRGASYRGRVSSDRAGCKVARRVVLRRVGFGTRRFGFAYSRGDGTYRINRINRLRGRVYAAVTERGGPVLCRGARSPSIAG